MHIIVTTFGNTIEIIKVKLYKRSGKEPEKQYQEHLNTEMNMLAMPTGILAKKSVKPKK